MHRVLLTVAALVYSWRLRIPRNSIHYTRGPSRAALFSVPRFPRRDKDRLARYGKK